MGLRLNRNPARYRSWFFADAILRCVSLAWKEPECRCPCDRKFDGQYVRAVSTIELIWRDTVSPGLGSGQPAGPP
jgi:hypothetical protein